MFTWESELAAGTVRFIFPNPLSESCKQEIIRCMHERLPNTIATARWTTDNRLVVTVRTRPAFAENLLAVVQLAEHWRTGKLKKQ